MPNKIPYLDERQAKENYVKVLTEKLGSSSRLRFSPATLTEGIIVSRGDMPPGTLGFDGTHRVYVLGISNGTHGEERGLGVMLSEESDLSKYLTLRGFEGLSERALCVLKRLDTTEQLISELKAFEEFVYAPKQASRGAFAKN